MLSDVVPVEGVSLPEGNWTFAMIEDRLVEAMITCWRNPDRERGWQRLRSAWPDAMIEGEDGDWAGMGAGHSSSDVAIRPASLTRRDVAEMEEAFGWATVITDADRRIVGAAISQLARGARQVSWSRMLSKMGMRRGAGGLQMRYERAIAKMADALNRRNPRANVSTPQICTK